MTPHLSSDQIQPGAAGHIVLTYTESDSIMGFFVLYRIRCDPFFFSYTEKAFQKGTGEL